MEIVLNASVSGGVAVGSAADIIVSLFCTIPVEFSICTPFQV